MTAQLELFDDAIGDGDAVPAPELRRDIPAGAARLLAALVRQGTTDAAAMAELAIGMEERAFRSSALQARRCRCDHPIALLDGYEIRCVLCGKGPAA